jgi:hypothetical protein
MILSFIGHTDAKDIK